MKNNLAIRSYSLMKQGHSHAFHQLVLPLKGGLNIEVGRFHGKIRPGQCVVVKAGEFHYFTAQTEARFVVADLQQLPSNLSEAESVVFSVNPPLLHYLAFIEQQLNSQVNQQIEQLMMQTFCCLLAEQQVLRFFDHRIQKVLDYIESHLATSLSNQQLAAVAYLSLTQLKKLFKQQTGLSISQYVRQARMEKAQALLRHTDYPIQIVAQTVGYSDHAAFSRSFAKYCGMSPSQYAR
ncbi:helix-turn-helix domain-containing protein [Agarivorans sp.]|uniref:helix-turn-helix domain-containing protein n=1 Tax=Agarivorans sp. TaxID=1872412 RepID=UPI003D049958